jgi:hypothetical protein
MKTATVNNTYDMIKANPDLDDNEMAALLIENFYFTERATYSNVVDIVQTTRKELK